MACPLIANSLAAICWSWLRLTSSSATMMKPTRLRLNCPQRFPQESGRDIVVDAARNPGATPSTKSAAMLTGHRPSETGSGRSYCGRLALFLREAIDGDPNLVESINLTPTSKRNPLSSSRIS